MKLKFFGICWKSALKFFSMLPWIVHSSYTKNKSKKQNVHMSLVEWQLKYWKNLLISSWKLALLLTGLCLDTLYMLIFFSFQMSQPHFSLPTSFKRLFPSWLFNWKSRTRSGRKHTCNLFHRLSAELLKQPFNVNAKLRKMKKRRPSPLKIASSIM